MYVSSSSLSPSVSFFLLLLLLLPLPLFCCCFDDDDDEFDDDDESATETNVSDTALITPPTVFLSFPPLPFVWISTSFPTVNLCAGNNERPFDDNLVVLPPFSSLLLLVFVSIVSCDDHRDNRTTVRPYRPTDTSDASKRPRI